MSAGGPAVGPMSGIVLACDDISQVGLRVLGEAGFEVLRRPRITPEALRSSIVDARALLVRSRTRVTDELLACAPRLELIGRAGFSLDTIDVEAASRRGIAVMHSPEGTSVAAAEFAVGLIFALARHLPQAHGSMSRGRWEKRRFRGVQIEGKTLGVIGMGAVGGLVVKKAAAVGMRPLVHDPAVSAAAIAAAGGLPASWDDLLSESDFVTVHVPSGPLTRGLVGDAAFSRMKDGVRVLVTSRGGVVSEAALVRALRSGKVAGAAVDAFDEEPPLSSELRELPQVILTPHLVASTFEAQIHVAVNLAQQVRDFFSGVRRGVVNEDALG